ncbi:heterokaryon incompatibility protein-domain-containing protein [Dendryphion nanum]|uniref:Heterokaryon incompatibility protein-domain-containing protein n=1 Tax=Dendryphion nanum TaxID=256645 RepID=A0A9P9I9L0_9PLEO|nr:heterokaryon incompatibility protein-domain-containing protein [Dendryphion nanum]
MRLINTHTIKLHEFYDESTLPRYAILSHTWGSDELTFQELSTLPSYPELEHPELENRRGWYKIKQCCVQAVADGLEYAWVDTTCIDKSSSAELSEAINSMFRWYKNSAVCYAYIDDIHLPASSIPKIVVSPGDPTGHWTKYSGRMLPWGQLAEARWFRRGWTLQELIAPDHIVFYVEGWKFIGNKTEFRNALSAVTGIPVETLMRRNPETRSVAHRMGWAANRTTTRIEDLAYCLMGIFDVNMPLLYGEGEKAFVRLQEEIMKDSDDQSLFAWKPVDTRNIATVYDIPALPREEGISIFANHPRQFASCSLVKPAAGDGEPYSLTNKGVRMKAPMISITEDIHILVLECHGMFGPLGIIVQKIHRRGSNRFFRHKYVDILSLARTEINISPQVQTVYLCKDIPTLGRATIASGVYTMS